MKSADKTGGNARRRLIQSMDEFYERYLPDQAERGTRASDDSFVPHWPLTPGSVRKILEGLSEGAGEG
jgi:hypothetical protein